MIFKVVLYLSTDSQYQVLRQARSYEDADDSSAGIPMYEEHRYIRSLHQGILDRQKVPSLSDVRHGRVYHKEVSGCSTSKDTVLSAL